MSVTVVSCLYGDGFGRFVSEWDDAIGKLDPRPDEAIVLADRHYPLANAQLFITASSWRHRQAAFLHMAIRMALTDWVWIVDIDDRAMPDALDGLEDVEADVWQVGFERSDGEVYLPPRMSNADYLASERNVYVGSSMIRTEAFRAVGGFDDIALQDWALWRKLARADATFEPSTRPHFRYTLHAMRRGETELTLDVRADHLAEMMEAELAYA